MGNLAQLWTFGAYVRGRKGHAKTKATRSKTHTPHATDTVPMGPAEIPNVSSNLLEEAWRKYRTMPRRVRSETGTPALFSDKKIGQLKQKILSSREGPPEDLSLACETVLKVVRPAHEMLS